ATASLTSLSTQVPELIQQAKKANTWEQADAIFTQNVQKSELAAKEKTALLDFLKRGGGAQSVIQNSPKVFEQGRSAIEQDVTAIKSKQASLLFDLIIPPALAKPNETVCSVLWHAAGILAGIGAFMGAFTLTGAHAALLCPE